LLVIFLDQGFYSILNNQKSMRLRDASEQAHIIILCVICQHGGCYLFPSGIPSCPVYLGLSLMAGSLLCSPLQIVHDNYILYVFAPNRESRQRWVFTLKEGDKTPVPTKLL